MDMIANEKKLKKQGLVIISCVVQFSDYLCIICLVVAAPQITKFFVSQPLMLSTLISPQRLLEWHGAIF